MIDNTTTITITLALPVSITFDNPTLLSRILRTAAAHRYTLNLQSLLPNRSVLFLRQISSIQRNLGPSEPLPSICSSPTISNHSYTTSPPTLTLTSLTENRRGKRNPCTHKEKNCAFGGEEAGGDFADVGAEEEGAVAEKCLCI